MLVVVDQFEELFAFRRAGAGRDNVASRDEAAAFVAMLLRTAADTDSRVRIVLTMRSDFIGDCEAFLGLPEAVSRSQFLVPRLNRSQMEEAIVRPGQSLPAQIPAIHIRGWLGQPHHQRRRRSAGPIAADAAALMRTWKYSDKKRLTHDDYGLLAGGIEEALSKHADAAWEEIKDDRLRQIARRMFLLLCDVSPDGQITRRRPRISEVMAVAGAKPDEVEAVVRAFQRDDRNFLLPAAPTPLTEDTVLDLSHEALLRQWKLFAKWMDQERQDAAELRRLCDLAKIRREDPKKAGLLPARDLGRIAHWETRVSAQWSRRYVAPSAWGEALAFVTASQENAQRQQDIRVLIAMVLVVATVLSTLAADRPQGRIECNHCLGSRTEIGQRRAQCVGPRPLPDDRRGRRGSTSSPEERAALWDLAEL